MEIKKNRFPTPLWPEILPESVYPPSEDTFLLIDALENDFSSISQLNPCFCCEIGCGSGIVINFFKKYCSPNCECFGVDINLEALEVTRKTSMLNENEIEVIQSDIFNSISNVMNNKFDIILFNPPYVPTDEEEMEHSQVLTGGSSSIYSTWAGDGMEVTWRLLFSLDRFLSDEGFAYVVFLSSNNPKNVRIKMKEKGYSSKIVIKREAGIELLYVIKFFRNKK